MSYQFSESEYFYGEKMRGGNYELGNKVHLSTTSEVMKQCEIKKGCLFEQNRN